MSSNINIYLLKNQKNIFDQYKAAFGESFAEKDLVTIENNTSSVSNLKNVSKVVFEYIYACALNGRGIWMAHKTLADKLGYCVTSIKDALNYLQSLGLVSWVSGKKNYTTNQYYVHISLLAHEAVRILKDYLQCAWLAWCRRLIRFSVNFSILSGVISTSVNNDSDRECLPRNSNIHKEYNNQRRSKNIYIKSECRSECINVENRKRTRKHYTFSQKNQENVRMQYQNAKVYEDFENNHGFTFTPNAKTALDEFDSETTEQSLLQAKRLGKVNFGYIIGTCNGKYADAKKYKDTSRTSLLRDHLGIKVGDDKTIEYDPMSDNSRVSKTPSNGKATVYTTFVDSQGRKRVRLPDGGSLPAYEPRPKHVEDSGAEKIQYVMNDLASGEWYDKFPNRELADQTAKAMMTVGKAQELGDEDLKRKTFFQHLASAVSGHGNLDKSLRDLAKNTPNSNDDKKTNPDIHTP